MNGYLLALQVRKEKLSLKRIQYLKKAFLSLPDFFMFVLFFISFFAFCFSLSHFLAKVECDLTKFFICFLPLVDLNKKQRDENVDNDDDESDKNEEI